MADHNIISIDRDRPLLDLAVTCDYRTTTEFIDIMAERYPFLVVTSIGETILSKKIHMLTLGNENSDSCVLYVGSHHGCEWVTTQILLRFVNELCEYYKNAKQPFGINLQQMLSKRCLRIVPLLNADGVDIQINGVDKECLLYDRLKKMSRGDFSKWQANARGVDLNHNYDAGFNEYKILEIQNNITAGATRYSGEYPFSEPESGSLANYISFNDSVKMVMTLHASGEVIYYTSDGYAPPKAKEIAKKLSMLSGYELSAPNGLSAYGGLTDWFIKEFDRPSFTIECGEGYTPIPYTSYYNIYAGIREMLMLAPQLI